VFPWCVGAEPVAGPGPGLYHHREALHKRLASLLSFSGDELRVLQPVHLRLAAQQGAHAPQPPPVALAQQSEADGGEGDGGEADVQELIFLEARSL